MAKRKAAGRKAVAYLRVSGRGQVEGDGFPRQREAIEQWAASNGAEVIAWYEEKGVSGTLAERPALARMLVDLRENHTDVGAVVVEKADRLARELHVQEAIVRELTALERELVSATEGDLAGDPTRALVRQIMGAVAQYDKTMVVQKLAAARARLREREGRCEGRKPFGFYPGEAETLERIRELRRLKHGKRAGVQKIAVTLNREGRPSRSGKPWNRGSVAAIVARAFPGMAGG